MWDVLPVLFDPSCPMLLPGWTLLVRFGLNLFDRLG